MYILGSFLKVVDAVKGPFYPSPPPMPTFIVGAPGTEEYSLTEVFAPVSEKDKFDLKEPEDAL